ncbi:MAG: hypothetical protein WCL50_07800, partial [Spirochaetota bacterium]
MALLIGIVIIPAIALFIAGASYSAASLRRVVDDQVSQSLFTAEARLSDALYNLLELSARLVDDSEIRKVLAGSGSEIERTRTLDRAVSALLLFFPWREDTRFTIIDPKGRIFTNWSRNLEEYSFLTSLPIARGAFEERGHAVWEGFSPAYIREERKAGLSYVTVARTFPDFGEGGRGEALLLLGLSDRAVAKILAEGRLGSRSLLLFATAEGSVIAKSERGIAAGGSGDRLAAVLASSKPGSAAIELGQSRYAISSSVVTKVPQQLKDLRWRL